MPLPIDFAEDFGAVAAIPTATWTELASYTVPGDRYAVVRGVGCSLAALTSVRYRLRVQVDGADRFEAQVLSGETGTLSTIVKAQAGQVISLQVRHAEVAGQDFSGALHLELFDTE